MDKNYFMKVKEDIAGRHKEYERLADYFIRIYSRGKKLLFDGRDIFDEAFCRCIESKRKWKLKTDIDKQFKGIIKSIVRDEIASKWLRPGLKSSTESIRETVQAPDTQPENKIDAVSTLDNMFSWAASKKDKNFLKILQLTYQGFTPSEIAEAENINIDKVKNIKRLMKKKFFRPDF